MRALRRRASTAKGTEMPADGHRHPDKPTRPDDYWDHDHSAEDAVITAFEDPTPSNQLAAEQAVALLQRRYDRVLRRLDGGDTLPAQPTHRHNPAETPEDCLGAVLHELAGVRLADRAETLAHGLEALHHLVGERDEARDWARGYEHGMFTVDTHEPPAWLTKGLADDA